MQAALAAAPPEERAPAAAAAPAAPSASTFHPTGRSGSGVIIEEIPADEPPAGRAASGTASSSSASTSTAAATAGSAVGAAPAGGMPQLSPEMARAAAEAMKGMSAEQLAEISRNAKATLGMEVSPEMAQASLKSLVQFLDGVVDVALSKVLSCGIGVSGVAALGIYQDKCCSVEWLTGCWHVLKFVAGIFWHRRQRR